MGITHIFWGPYSFTEIAVIDDHSGGHRAVIDDKVTRAWRAHRFQLAGGGRLDLPRVIDKGWRDDNRLPFICRLVVEVRTTKRPNLTSTLNRPIGEMCSVETSHKHLCRPAWAFASVALHS